MGYVEGFRHDVFVSYTHNDDALADGGWVRGFKVRLEAALNSELGLRTNESVNIFIDNSLPANQRVEDLLDEASASAVFLAMSSRSYIARDSTMSELSKFVETQPDPSRLFLVEIFPLLDGEKYQGLLSAFIPKVFHDRAPGSKANVPIPHGDSRFNGLVQDLAMDICKELRRMRGTPKPRVHSHPAIDRSTPSALGTGKTVLLAQTSEDREEEENQRRARRYLEMEGFQVLPKADYPQGGREFETAFTEDARAADLFVQLFGGRAGRRPRDLPAGYIRRQFDIAREVGLASMQWRPMTLKLEDVEDPDHLKLLNGEAVRLEGFESFMKAVVEKLRSPPPPSITTSVVSQVYIPFHALDEGFGRIVHEEFHKAGIPVHGPLSEELLAFATGQKNVDSRSVREYLNKTLVQSDAIVIIYGSDPFWSSGEVQYYCRVRPKREVSARVEAICVGPPSNKPDLPIAANFIRKIDCSHSLEPLRALIAELTQ